MRKLASIQKVINVAPIKGADRIERIDILEWECVAKKGEFKPGDLVVYFEIDSILPPHQAWDDFMQSRGYRVKTIRLKKQIAQGLAIHISNLPELDGKNLKEGDDVTSLLKVKKWEDDEPETKYKRQHIGKKKSWYWIWALKYNWGRNLFRYIYGKGGKKFPTYLVPRTDETRIQTAPGLLNQAVAEELKDGLYCTEKIDGQSATYLLSEPKGWTRKRDFLIVSRGYIKSPNDGSNWSTLAKKLPLERILREHLNVGDWFAIQGELIGPGIQKNKYKRDEFEYYVYSIFDIKNQTYKDMNYIKNFCYIHGLNMVPILDENYSIQWKIIKDIVNESAGISKLYPTKREGIVIRAKSKKKISFKVVDPKFLLKHGE